MFTTIELEKKITEEILRKLPDADFSGIKFSHYKEGMPRGTYIFSLSDKYCYMDVDGFTISREATEFDEIFWLVLKQIIFERACKFECENRIYGQDFRRLFFQKEIEECSLFGEEYKKRIVKEIDKILKDAPYDDENASKKPPGKKFKSGLFTKIILWTVSAIIVLFLIFLPYFLP